jgi:hypothetical protein
MIQTKKPRHRPGTKGTEERQACHTSIATHPRSLPERYAGAQVEIIATGPEGQATRASLWGGEDIDHQPGWRIICGSGKEFR